MENNNFVFNSIAYDLKILPPQREKGINIPSLIAIPLCENFNNQIILETNNLETDNKQKIIEQAFDTFRGLASFTDGKPGTIVVPLLPSYKNGPYLQQLSKECFDLSAADSNYRIDLQVRKIIEVAKEISEEEKGVKFKDKIFLHGYSSSGVFAQRFALLHPEVVGTACIGGASGSIPIPFKDLPYPLGVGDYKEITGKDFNTAAYRDISFDYYVGEKELSATRIADDGKVVPIHDMSFLPKSISSNIGETQRKMLGKDMFKRADKCIELSRAAGVKNISQTVFPGMAHSQSEGYFNHEVRGKFVNESYKDNMLKLDNERSVQNEPTIGTLMS